MVELVDAFQQCLTQHGIASTYWVAYSGGMDSHALLSVAACARDRLGFRLKAIHVNDHLHSDADQWVHHCQAICDTLNVELVVKTIQVNLKKGESLEAVGRTLRYAVLANCLSPHDVLLTAHHEQDQAETVLLQLLRGAGPKGLSGMPVCKPLGEGLHMRPFLAIAKQILHQYAKANRLHWVEDTSNQNTQLARNYLRHEVLPRLLQQYPSALETIARSAIHCATVEQALEGFAERLLHTLTGSQPNTLSISKLMQYDEAQQSLLLRTWIQALHLPLPSTKKMETLLRCVLSAQADRMPRLTWDGVVVRRYRDDLYILPEAEPSLPFLAVTWDMVAPLLLPGLGCLVAWPVKGGGLCQAVAQVTVACRQGGEVLRLPGRLGRRTLKHLFQEWGIPTWARERLPLLFVGEECIGVVGYALDPRYTATGDDLGYELVVLPFDVTAAEVLDERAECKDRQGHIEKVTEHD